MTTATRNGTFPRDARSAAALYLTKELALIPLPTRSKGEGLKGGWQQLRLTDDTLDEHFPPGVDRNIGVLNGEPSGNAADVDLDCPEAVAAAPLLLPQTGWVFGRKSAPRSHWIYRADRPLDTAQEKYSDVGGNVLVELRGTGGMTVYPPSVHKETGESITWDAFTEPADVDLADLQRAAREVAAVALLARHWPGKGSRQDAFLALVGALMRAGWQQDHVERFVEALAIATSDDEARKRVQAVAQTAGKLDQDRKVTGWSRLEQLLGPNGRAVVARVRDWLGMVQVSASASAPAKKVRVLEPYRPFPVEALPAPLAEYVRQGALALGCDPAYLALPALAVAAGVIGNTRVIRLKRGWDEPAVVWSTIVGDSGTLKSPAFSSAVRRLYAVQERLLRQYRLELLACQEAMKEWQNADKDERGERPERPVLRKVVCSDTTIEKLAEILEDNPRGVLVARDELSAWLGSFGRYKGKNGGTDLPNWLEMFTAGTVMVDRKTGDRPTLFVKRAAASIGGGIQPGVLARALTPEFLDSGLAARLLMAMPSKSAKKWSEAEVAPEVERAYHDVLDRLLALAFDTREEEQVPHVLTLSPDAKAAWVAFYDAWAKEQAAVEGELAAAFSKLEGYAARFALVHHVVGRVARGDDDLVPVSRESVEAGVALCRWFAVEARRVYAILSESTDERDARRIVEFIQSHGGRITLRDFQRSNNRKYPTSAHAETALDGLVQDGLARWIELPAKKKGKPIKTIELCTTHDTHDTVEDGEDDDDPEHPDDPHDNDPRTGPGPGPPSPPETGCDGVRPDAVNPVMRVVRRAAAPAANRPNTGKAEPGPGPGTVSGDRITPPVFQLVRDRAALDAVATALDHTVIVGLDVETTGLNPRSDRIRLLSLGCDTTDGGTIAYLVDCFAVDPAPLWEILAPKELVLQNAAFDLSFLARLGFTPAGKVHDTMLLAHLLTAGTNEKVNLAACCRRWLGRDLDKAEQMSDWSGELTEAQLAYAARDVEVLAPLLKTLAAKVKEAGLVEVAEIERRCLPGVVWMGRHGVALDRDAWRALARTAGDEAIQLREELNRSAPPKPGVAGCQWNWDSPQQARAALAQAGCEVDDTADETLAAADHPLAKLLRRYRLTRKRAGTYGTDWLAHVANDGRVYPNWRQTGAASGRMSCSNPNMQQLPRGDYRKCIVAPPGRVLVKADYSQIELRIAAKVSGDKALLATYQRGDDLHTITARNVLGIQDVSKEHRQLAKALNFGLLYGMGARGFRQYAKGQYGLGLTDDEARRYREAFFRAYPGLAAWHRRVRVEKATQTRTLAGRRRLLAADAPDTHRLNSPVQGSGADGLKLALALLWERRDQVPGAFPVLAVHDELVVETDADQADAAAAWLKSAMLDAMAPLIDPVPVGVEVTVARTWGGD